MRILLCTNTFTHIHHGPAKFANLVLEINQLFPQHEIRILTEDVEVSSRFVYKMEMEFPSYLKLFSQFIRMFEYDRNIKRIKNEYDFDVVVFINSFFGFINSKKQRNYFSVGMINDDNNLDTSLKNISFSRLWFKRFLFKQFERKASINQDMVIANSDYLASKISKAYSLPSNKVKRLYKAIDFSKSTLNIHRSFSQPYKIVFVKSDFRRGGIETLSKAIEELSDKKFQLTVIGPHEKYRSEVLGMFRNVKNCEVDFLGEQPQNVVFHQLTNGDIFCVPSYKEALGVANIEALAFGIPVVTSTAGGIPEVLNYGKCGWMSKPKDIHSLAEALKNCIESAEERGDKVVKGGDFVRKNFDKIVMFESFLEMLENLKR